MPSTARQAKVHAYRLAGLTFASTIPLAGRPAACSDPDVCVRIGPVDLPGPDAEEVGTQVHLDRDGSLYLDISDVARFRVRDGNEITVEPSAPDVPDQDIRTFLLGSALGAILHQRGIYPLHATTVDIGGRAIALVGESGAGKSTLGHALTRRGHVLIADDITPIRMTVSGAPEVLPLLPQVKLWGDALKAATASSDGLDPIRKGLDKYRVPIANIASEPVGLHAIIQLIAADAASEEIERVRGMAAVRTVEDQVYRALFGYAIRGRARLFDETAQLASRVRVIRLRRRKDFGRIDALMDAVEAIARP
jgi:hypothetical protein